jgi:hypothetical protein
MIAFPATLSAKANSRPPAQNTEVDLAIRKITLIRKEPLINKESA